MPTGQLTLTVESNWLVERKMSTFNKVNMGLQADRCWKYVCKYQLKDFMDSFVFMDVESGPAACFLENAEKL